MNEINDIDIRTHIVDAVVDVFDTMVSMEVEFSDSEPPDITGSGRMAATIDFVGNLFGTIIVQVPSEMTRLMMANVCDSGSEKVKQGGGIRGLLAEISNMIGGNLKSALNDAGHHCVISTPSITYGPDFTIKYLKMERLERFAFNHQESWFFVEVGLNTKQTAGDGDEPGPTDLRSQLDNADIAKINALDINTRVSEAVIDVFDTMLSITLEPLDPNSAGSLEGLRNVGSVNIAGDANGRVSIHVDDRFSREMATEMLGMEVEEIDGDDEIRDMLGEMINNVGGNLQSAYIDAGLMCALSAPCFTTGSDFKIETPGIENYEQLGFRCGKNIIFVEFGVNISGLTQEDTHQENGSAAPPGDMARTDQPAPAHAQRDGAVESRASTIPDDFDLDLLLDIPLEIKVELGRARIKIHELLKLAPGSAIKLIKLEGDPVDILVNGILIARGEVIVQHEKYGVRIIEITNRMDRIRSFSI